ncbi:MAG: hypothetical protein AMJ84_08230 [Acidithiobacillales bacterium SM23_46]|jgi:cytochrome c oxidase assembly protein subunit 11|nr:MAG: hypothetical protein AMJ84_08230 [Acidithiobacillales bacterium SM23_46]KPL27158.1 MAG: hypothetical protein AMJ72_10390 [Acidithiobacillales bacterium SM1_46]
MSERAKAADGTRKTVRNLVIVVVAMFGFGYLMAPLYDVLCKATGIGGRTGRTDAQAVGTEAVDSARTITVEFTGNTNSGLPWEFRPLVKKLEVHPGQVYEVKYLVRNPTDETITAQAVPSVTPFVTATHFKKLECFCFTQQTLKAGESREMPVRFVVDAGVDREVRTITLSYAFFNTDKASAQRYGAAPQDPIPGAHDHHAHAAGG